MNMRRFALAAAMAAGIGSAAHAQGFSDNSVSLTYGPDFKEPGVSTPADPKGVPISKEIISVTHVDGWKYGSNFANIDALFSNNNDKANSINGMTGNNSNANAVEVYALYRGQLSPNAIFDTTITTIPHVTKEIDFEIGGDFNTKNTAFAPQKKLFVVGPNFHLDVPYFAFLNIGLHFSQEWNQNGIVGHAVNFSPAFEFESAYLVPLDFVGIPLRFSGFANFVEPKGKDGFGNSTKTEFLTQNNLILDLGGLAFDKPHFLDIYVGYQYWLNKFGNNSNSNASDFTPGSLASTVYFGTSLHF
jgi:nucleoside-specific outer membrane channel protein Tsx